MNDLLIKKTPKVTYPRGKPSEYFVDFISAHAENTVFLIYPSDRYASAISPKNSGEKKVAPEASLVEFYRLNTDMAL